MGFFKRSSSSAKSSASSQVSTLVGAPAKSTKDTSKRPAKQTAPKPKYPIYPKAQNQLSRM
ncbi:unnamed protein product [Umbelopsis ramanniana]